MRTLTNIFGAAVASAVTRETTIELQDLSAAIGNPAQAESEHIARRSPVSTAVRITGVLAFGQSLLFLALWLLLCASAGAAPPAKKVEFNPVLQLSKFEPAKTRNPFAKADDAGVTNKTAAGVPLVMPALQLDGILYEAGNPSASVNGQLLTLNKIVHLDPQGANIPVKAVAITRRQVTLEVNGQKVELKLNSEEAPAGR